MFGMIFGSMNKTGVIPFWIQTSCFKFFFCEPWNELGKFCMKMWEIAFYGGGYVLHGIRINIKGKRGLIGNIRLEN